MAKLPSLPARAPGIGRGAAAALAGAGAHVVLNDVVADGLDGTLAAVHRAGTEGVVSVGDVRVRADVQRLVATAVSAFGGVDVMFANAAISRFAREFQD